MEIILKDVPRTIAKPTSKQNALYHILKCITIQFPEVGYVQGMNNIAATLMKFNTPEDSFMIMISLFKNYGLRENFLPQMPGLARDTYILLVLMKKYMPALYKKLNEMNYFP